MLAPSNSYLIMRQMTHCRWSGKELSQSCRDQSWETQKLLQKLKINWYISDGALICFSVLTPNFQPANLMPVIPAGIWGQFIRTPEPDQAPSVCPCGATPPWKRKNTEIPPVWGLKCWAENLLHAAHKSEGWRSFPVVIPFLSSHPAFSAGED